MSLREKVYNKQIINIITWSDALYMYHIEWIFLDQVSHETRIKVSQERRGAFGVMLWSRNIHLTFVEGPLYISISVMENTK